MQQERILSSEHSWTNPLNALQEVIHYSFIKFCIDCFSLWYDFFVQYILRVEKNYQHGLGAGSLEFQFLRPRVCLANPFRTLSLRFGLIGKTPDLMSRNNFVKKKFLSASTIVIMSWQDVTRIFPLPRCQGVQNKTCLQLSLSHILFQNLKNYSLGDVQRFCYHS